MEQIFLWPLTVCLKLVQKWLQETAAKIWNSLDETDKKLLDFQLKKKLKIHFIDSY